MALIESSMMNRYFPSRTADLGTMCSTLRSSCVPGLPSFDEFGPPAIAENQNDTRGCPTVYRSTVCCIYQAFAVGVELDCHQPSSAIGTHR